MNRHKCIICKKTLNNGIMINGRVICKSCEDRLVRSEVDTDLYDYYRDCIKRRIAGSILREETIDFCEHFR